MNRRFIFLLLTVVSISNAALGQINGTVLDLESQPIEGAVVMLLNSSDSTLINSSITDVKGVFSFQQKTQKGGNIAISMLGYESVVLPANNEMGNIFLKISSINLDDVVVKGASWTAQSDRFVYAVTNPVIIAGNDAIGILGLTPLLKANDDGVSILNKPTVVYVNGRRIKLTGGSLVNYLRGIPAESILKIEVMPVANSTYGGGNGEFGVVNIIVKKNETDGIKGYIAFMDQQSYYNRQSGNINLNVRKNKLGIDASIWGNNSPSFIPSKNLTTFKETGNKIETQSDNVSKPVSIGTWIGVDYEINDRQVLGLIFMGNFWKQNDTQRNRSEYGKINSSAIDSIYNTFATMKSPGHNVGLNLNYQLKTDNKGSVFTVDADYTNYFTSIKRTTYFDKIEGEDIIDSETLLQTNPLNISIWSAKADYRHYFKKYGSITAGIDSYTTKYNNEFTDSNEEFNLDNHFIFTESISSVFVSYENSWNKKLSTTVGVRLENAYNKGTQIATDDRFEKNRFRVLPTVFLNYAINKDNNISYSLSNRVLYPGYGLLNPFKSYSSPTSYSVGNPYLEAQNIMAHTLTYFYKGKFMAQASASLGNNAYGSFKLPDGENGMKIISENFGRRNSYNLVFGMYGSYFNNIWQANNTLRLFYNEWKGEVDDITINHGNFSWFISLINDFTLSKVHQIVLQVVCEYYAAANTETTHYKPYSQFNLGIRKALGDFNIHLFVNDIFRTMTTNPVYDYMGVMDKMDTYSDNQKVGIRVTYSFGNKRTRGNRYRQTSSVKATNRLN